MGTFHITPNRQNNIKLIVQMFYHVEHNMMHRVQMQPSAQYIYAHILSELCI
jgi:hypothetical protein